MNKYVIELRPDCKVVQQVCESNGKVYVDSTGVGYLEELNSDYINEHFGDLQDAAYKKGLHDGESKCRYCNEYQRGLNDAWEAARKIVLSPDEGGTSLPTLFAVFGSGSMQHVFRNFSASEVIEKLNAYEEKQKADDEIKVGDVVEWDGDKYIVTYLNKGINTGEVQDYDVMGADGSVVDHVSKCAITKTGKHFDIEKILEAMKK